MTENDPWTIIRHEHALIREKLAQIKQKAEPQDLWALVEWLWSYTEEFHHHQEETLLYERLRNQPRLREGGPMCMYFFGAQLADPPLERATRATGESAPLLQHQLAFQTQNSPLMIPISEHRATRLILRHLLDNKSVTPTEKLRHLLELYSEIQTTNMEKEERCLKHLSNSILDVNANAEVAKQWKRPGQI